MKGSQKKPSTTKSCRVLSRKVPDRAVYTTAMQTPVNLPRTPRSAKGFAASSEPLPDPHDWPVYGGLCWRQAYDEAKALNALVMAAQLWAYAQGSGYMPQSQKEAFFAAYVQAKLNYQLCWQVMEDCLTGAQV